MPRPPSDRVDEGFRIWSTEANRNDTKTAAIMGLSQETVSYWHRTYGWDARYLTVLQPDGELFAGLARAHIRAILPAAADTITAISWRPRSRSTTTRESRSGRPGPPPIGMRSKPPSSSPSTASKGVPGRTASPLETQAMGGLPTHDPAFDALSVEEQACAIIEANIQSVNTRIRRGKRV